MKKNINNNKKKLILFDIDGTLIYPGNGAKNALKKTIYKNFGINPKVTYNNTAGKTDRWIMRDILKEAGIDQKIIKDKMEDITADYLIFIKEEYNKDNDAKVYPGVHELLEKLNEMENIYLGLLTGNIEQGARVKLAPFDLNKYFMFGAFGSDGIYREELVDIALKKAEKLYGISFFGKNIIIIGDTVNDVTCGRKVGAKSIAIARHPEFIEKIKEAEPDFLFNGFEDTSKLIEAILL